MTAWLMAHGPIPSFQKYLLEPARLSSPGLVYGKYAQEAVSLTEKYRGVLRICPWTNSVIWMDLEWSGYISAQRDVSLFFFSVLLGVFDLLLMKQTLREGIHGPQLTSGWNEAFLHCNRMFNYKPSILGYLRYLHLWKPPNLLKHSTTRRIWRGRWDFCSVPLLGESRGSEIPLPGSAICRFQICHGLSRQLS